MKKKSQHFSEFSQLNEIAETVLKLAKSKGALQAETSTAIEDGFTVNVRMGDVETIEHHREKGVGITLYFGKKTASVTTSDVSKEALKEAVDAACNIAKYTEEDPCAGLADSELMATEFPDLDLYHAWQITPEQAIGKALQCENQARSLDKRIVNSEGAMISTQQGFFVYANSHGFLGSVPTTRHSASCALIAENGDGMERDYAYTVARDSNDLLSLNKIAELAAHRTVERLGARSLKTQKVPVLFRNDIARSLVAQFILAISGNNLYRKASFLIDHLGKQVFPHHINLYENPLILKGLGSSAYDREGVATREQAFVQDGILSSYVLNSYSARQLKMETTANSGGLHNCFMTSQNDLDFEALLKKMDRGVLVTELIGQGVNLVTGDYSRGAVGFWVENGEIKYPVSEITISGNLRDMFLNLVAVGNDIDKNGNIQIGSILLEQMTVAGH